MKIKSLEYYMSLPYRMEIIPDTDEGGYTIKFPDLPGCLTCADNEENIISIAEDAKKVWLKAALEDGTEIPEPLSDQNTIPLDRYGQLKSTE